MAQSYKIRLEAVHLELATAHIYLDGTRLSDGKPVRCPLNPQMFSFPDGSDIISDMEKLADGFKTRIGQELNVIQES